MRVVLIGMICVMFAGCAYQTGSLLSDEDIRTIHVNNFRNDTFRSQLSSVNKVSELGIETRLTDEVIRRFMLDGTLRVVSEEEADVVLDGRISYFNLSPRAFDSTDRRVVAEYGVVLNTEVTLRDPHTGDILWSDDISKGASYSITGALARSEDAAVAEASTELARDIVIRTVEGW